jgi:hypothetical protein
MALLYNKHTYLILYILGVGRPLIFVPLLFLTLPGLKLLGRGAKLLNSIQFNSIHDSGGQHASCTTY